METVLMRPEDIPFEQVRRSGIDRVVCSRECRIAQALDMHLVSRCLNSCRTVQVAFSSISLALRFYVEDMRAGRRRLHHGVIEKAEGSLPNDPASYRLRDHMAMDISPSSLAL